ncbi:hypothetical protein [Nocardia transvalensis]|uniref:hypothetical protein n=1 Tax=Nocardia transvalensis TaxID=37333 RepID=UPI001893C78B|nr:hypothetical protein [Nocardia transvalensis]MBF6333178.1 hypothetical protein [Nocardia transvalensis]
MSDFDFWRDVIGDDLVVGGVAYSATEWESDGEGGVQRIADRVRRELDERFDPEVRAHADLVDLLDSPFSVTFAASAPDADNRVIQITFYHGWTASELEAEAGQRPETDSRGISPYDPADLRVAGEYRIESESLERLLQYLAAEPVLQDHSSSTDQTTGRPPVVVPEKERTILQQHQSRIDTLRDAVRSARSPAALAAARVQVAAELRRHEASAPDLHGGASDTDIAVYDITRDGYRALVASLDDRIQRRSGAQAEPTTQIGAQSARPAAVSEQNRALVFGPKERVLREDEIIALPDDLADANDVVNPGGANLGAAVRTQPPDAAVRDHRDRVRERFDPQYEAYSELEKVRSQGVNVVFAAPTDAQPHRVVQITFTKQRGFAARELVADPEWSPSPSIPAPMYLDGIPLRPIGDYCLDDTERLGAVIGQLKRGPMLNGTSQTRGEPVLVPAAHEAILLEFLTDLDNHLGRVQEKGTLDALLAAHQAVSSEMSVMRLGDMHPEIYWECEILQAELDGRIRRVLNGLEPLDEKATGYVDPDPWGDYLDPPTAGLMDSADTRSGQIADQIEIAVRQRFDPTYPQWKALHDAETRGVYVEFAAPAAGTPGRRVSIRYNSVAGQWQAREYQHEHNEHVNLTEYVGEYRVRPGVHPWLGEFLDGLETRPVLIDARTGEAIPRPAVHPPDIAQAQLWKYATAVADLAAGLDRARETADYRAAYKELVDSITEPGHSAEWSHAAEQLLDEFGGRIAISDALRESSGRATDSIGDRVRPPEPTNRGGRLSDGSREGARGGDHTQCGPAERAEATSPDSTTSWAQRIRRGLSKPPAAHRRRRI